MTPPPPYLKRNRALSRGGGAPTIRSSSTTRGCLGPPLRSLFDHFRAAEVRGGGCSIRVPPPCFWDRFPNLAPWEHQDTKSSSGFIRFGAIWRPKTHPFYPKYQVSLRFIRFLALCGGYRVIAGGCPPPAPYPPAPNKPLVLCSPCEGVCFH